MNAHSYARNMQLLDGVLIMATGPNEIFLTWLSASVEVSFMNLGGAMNAARIDLIIDSGSRAHIAALGWEENRGDTLMLFDVSCSSTSWEVWNESQ